MEQEITAHLENDHRTVEKLMKEARSTRDVATRAALFRAIDLELISHCDAEETILYPRVRREEGLKECAQHSENEHLEIKQKLAELRELDEGAKDWKVALENLEQCVSHHVEEEEEELFPELRKRLSEGERLELGQALIETKEQARRLGIPERSPRPAA